jgi:hypothetical protein
LDSSGAGDISEEEEEAETALITPRMGVLGVIITPMLLLLPLLLPDATIGISAAATVGLFVPFGDDDWNINPRSGDNLPLPLPWPLHRGGFGSSVSSSLSLSAALLGEVGEETSLGDRMAFFVV